MARAPKLYTKLVRRRGAIGSHFTLWLAEDHVLLVESTFFSERYQRVWLRDIQGLFVRPSREARFVTLISLGLLVVFGLLALLEGTAGTVFGVLAVLTSPFLLFGLLGARTCHFYGVTAVQRAYWPNVARRRQAKKLITRLEPLIREAQGGDTATLSAAPAEFVSTVS